jgi:hypothetical protein
MQAPWEDRIGTPLRGRRRSFPGPRRRGEFSARSNAAASSDRDLRVEPVGDDCREVLGRQRGDEALRGRVELLVFDQQD